MKRLLGILLILVLISVGIFASYIYQFSRTPYGDHHKSMHIKTGTPLSVILERLESEGIIADADLFRLTLILNGTAPKIRAGDYDFTPQMTPKEVTQRLLQGDFKIYRFTIPEGWTMTQIAGYLERQRLTEKEAFLTWCRDQQWIESLGLSGVSLEGYLYPSTYETYFPDDPRELIQLMVKTFQKTFTLEMKRRAEQLGLNIHDVVTLASIVEKETSRSIERPLIASVFSNRVRIQMPLQSDPTVIYGIDDFNGNLTRRHLGTYTPYNTYMIPGLPPGPIANPGKSALRAVLYPAETDYLYFVSKNNGTHAFAKTLKEHNRNVYDYQIKKSPHSKQTGGRN